jgi:uncharacterized membrane protein (DUF373 family)
MRRLFSFLLEDQFFLEALSRFQRALAKLLSVGMVLVIVAATGQLLLGIARELAPGQMPLVGNELIAVLGEVLTLLIAIEVLENVLAYLRDHAIQLELVLATAITAMARKIIVLPSSASDNPMLLLGLGFGTLSLSAAYWLLQRRKGDRISS